MSGEWFCHLFFGIQLFTQRLRIFRILRAPFEAKNHSIHLLNHIDPSALGIRLMPDLSTCLGLPALGTQSGIDGYPASARKHKSEKGCHVN